jgi:hypothetical protein
MRSSHVAALRAVDRGPTLPKQPADPGRVASRSTADLVRTFGNGMTVNEEQHFALVNCAPD